MLPNPMRMASAVTLLDILDCMSFVRTHLRGEWAPAAAFLFWGATIVGLGCMSGVCAHLRGERQLSGTHGGGGRQRCSNAAFEGPGMPAVPAYAVDARFAAQHACCAVPCCASYALPCLQAASARPSTAMCAPWWRAASGGTPLTSRWRQSSTCWRRWVGGWVVERPGGRAGRVDERQWRLGGQGGPGGLSINAGQLLNPGWAQRVASGQLTCRPSACCLLPLCAE